MDCKVLGVKPAHAAWLPSCLVEERTAVEVALTSGLSSEMQQFSWYKHSYVFPALALPLREQHFLRTPLAATVAGARLGFPHGPKAGGAVGFPSGVSGVGLSGSAAVGGSSCDVFNTHPSAVPLLTLSTCV